MTEYRYKPIEGNVRMLGDSVDIDGTLNVDGALTATGGIATLKLVSAPSGTSAGTVWTTGPPALTTEQMYVLCTAGATTWRIPVWSNA